MEVLKSWEYLLLQMDPNDMFYPNDEDGCPLGLSAYAYEVQHPLPSARNFFKAPDY